MAVEEGAFSALDPILTTLPGNYDVFFPAGRYRSLSKDVWAKCASLTLVSHGSP
jgi:hypothetical protein